MLSDKSEKNKYHIISPICGILKKKKEFIDTENRLIGGEVDEMDQGYQNVQTSCYKISLENIMYSGLL